VYVFMFMFVSGVGKYKKTCEGFCQRIKISAGRDSGTEGVLSYT